MKYSLKLKQMRGEKIDAAGKIMKTAEAANRALTAEEQKAYDALIAEAKDLREQVTRAENQEDLEADLERVEAAKPVAVAERPVTENLVRPGEQPVATRVDAYAEFEKPPAPSPRIHSRLRFAPDAKTAFRFGMWFIGLMNKHYGVAAWCKPRAVRMFGENAFNPNALYTEGTDTNGGYLVIPEFLNSMILLIQRYGVFRQNAKIIPMNSEQKNIPRRTAGLTAYPVGEGATGTESTKTWDRVNLVAKKWMVLTRMSSELQEDAVINMGDDLMGEIAYAFAVAEDNAGFIGDGSSTYAGILGLKNALQASAKYTQGTSNTWAAQVLGDLAGVQSLQPDFTVSHSSKWYCNKAYYYQVMRRLALAGGGNTEPIISEYGDDPQMGAVPTFFGEPVIFVSAMPNATATSGICLYYGDLGLAAKFGDRRELAIAMSQEASVGGQSLWERDEIGIKGVERFDINVHERGAATGAGAPLNALITA